MPDAATRPTKEDAYRLARRTYLRGERFDLGRMAAELGVNRVTLYRWVGTRDELFVEAVWQLTERTLAGEWDKASRLTGPRVPATLGGFLRAMYAVEGISRFAEESNEYLMRMMTTAEHDFHGRFVAATRAYLEQDVAQGRTAATVPVGELAYASVRIVESYVYAPTITRGRPDPEAAQRVLEALLRP